MIDLHLHLHLPREKYDQRFRHLLNTNPHLQVGEYLRNLRPDHDGGKDFLTDESWITTTKTLHTTLYLLLHFEVSSLTFNANLTS